MFLSFLKVDAMLFGRDYLLLAFLRADLAGRWHWPMEAPLVARLRSWPLLGKFPDGLNTAALALLGVVTWQLGHAALLDPLSAAIAGSRDCLVDQSRSMIGGALVGACSPFLMSVP